LDGRKEIALIPADVEEDGNGERIVAFEPQGRGVKGWCGVEFDVDLLRIEVEQRLISAKKDHGGEFDQTGVEVEGVGSGVAGFGWRSILCAEGEAAEDCYEEKCERETAVCVVSGGRG